MKTSTYLILIFLISVIGYSKTGDAGVAKLIDEKLNQEKVKTVKSGLKVVSLSSGEVFYSKNEEMEFIPASVTKMILTSALLYKLHPQFTYKSEVYQEAKANKVNIYIKPLGNPLFDYSVLWELLSKFKFYGIKEISGNLVLDLSAFPPQKAINDNFEEDKKYNTALSPFSFCFNTVNVRVAPGKIGQKAKVTFLPDIPYFEIRNKTISTKKDHFLNFSIEEGKNKQIIVLSGKVAASKEIYIKVLDPTEYIKATISYYLKKLGVILKNEILVGITPLNAEKLFIETGEQLPHILSLMNSYSNNFMAEQMLYTLGGEILGYPASREKGITVVEKFLVEDIGLTKNFKIENGSGLTDANKFRPAQLVDVLKWNYNKQYMPEFMTAINDGVHSFTLRKATGELKQNLRAKNGQLDNVSTVAGYLTTKKGDKLAFSFMFNDVSKEDSAFFIMLQYELLEVLFNNL